MRQSTNMKANILFLIPFYLSTINSKIWNFQDEGAKPDDDSKRTYNKNTEIFNQILENIQPSDSLYFPDDQNQKFYLNGGVHAENLDNITFIFDGTLIFQDNQRNWPRYEDSDKVYECMEFIECHNITWTSNKKGGDSFGTGDYGIIDGQGESWWGYLSYLRISENRPRLVKINRSTNWLVEKMFLKNSPYWTFYASDIDNFKVRYSKIDARYRDNATRHDLGEIRAFNTDGWNFAGSNVHVHDTYVWNDDDCFTVKQMDGNGKYAKCSENMLFENSTASGVGLTIGSIGATAAHSCVKNVTFKNIIMPNTFKGIYIKSRPSREGETGEITDILYQNITIIEPNQWAIWIGPQQAIYDNACSISWPFWKNSICPIPEEITFSNITLKDIFIESPRLSAGVLMGNDQNPMSNLLFDNVEVNNPSGRPWKEDGYGECVGVKNGYYRGRTWPVPKCFQPVKTCDLENPCAKGYYCTGNPIGTCQICPENGYCPTGSYGVILCPTGFKNSKQGSYNKRDCWPQDYKFETSQSIDFFELGGEPDNKSQEVFQHNTDLLNYIFSKINTKVTNRLSFPEGKTFYFNGNIRAENISNLIIEFNGKIVFQNDINFWPRYSYEEDSKERNIDAFIFTNFTNVTFTSNNIKNGYGIIDGQGAKWWGYIRYLKNTNDRPRLFTIFKSEKITYEKIHLINSPRWNFYAHDILDLTIRHAKVDCRYNEDHDTHGVRELAALNTDGFDVAGKNIHIHDVEIFNDDDTVAIKQLNGADVKAQCSENILVENVIASGVGLTIGSIGAKTEHSCVKNVTFRNVIMPKTFKGIYIKNRPSGAPGKSGEITNILYENITISDANQWPIWIGPQQAFVPTFGDACPLLWPSKRFEDLVCFMDEYVTFSDIKFKDIFIKNAKFSPGVILGPENNPFINFDFDNVVVENPQTLQFDDFYYCENAENAVYRRGTFPVPKCFSPAPTCDVENGQLCAYGYFCGGVESEECEICPIGFYCPDGLNQEKCPSGTTTEDIGAKRIDDCSVITDETTSTAASTAASTTDSTVVTTISENPITKDNSFQIELSLIIIFVSLLFI